ncbi:beta-ketoacyl-[acyl-carrier-protein] synthase II [Amycolatopsis coloradensis]|uniref:3-oxoacyl-[acyl-carrier-protein] synthase 2 n=1 Tax=Amycolatopsis coloradensis TaxID=76021 RepID=A0A1R0KZ14_9PSEU|nr:beta-ketoacyl-ACP synthase II [Amycolatopsis coloradensis]OLZ54580.1 beta-ketoacyl-[acyl-carrier-protein] synthase II [Amycolatopsis coloradensis]
MIEDEVHRDRRRAVITGWGAITPVGLTADDTWAALLEGRCGIAKINSFDTTGLLTQIAGEVKGFDADDYMPHKISRRMDTYAQYAVAATVQAVEAAKLTIPPHLAPRAGVLIGSGYGPVGSYYRQAEQLRTKGPRGISPFSAITGAMDSASGEVSMMFGATGPTRAISTACATGTDAIGEAARWIQHGYADIVLTGGTDCCVTAVDIAGSSNARALSRRNDDPERASRPFDKDRDGFIMSAGAGALVLEEATGAISRGRNILAEVIGYASTSDAYHWTSPHPEGLGARRAMRNALADAGIEPSEVDYINAHGTSTELNDETEVQAIRQVFGEHAVKIPVSSTKSMTGHMIGAAGAVELIAAGYAVQTGFVPPTINCDTPLDTEINFVPHRPQEWDTRIAMSNSFGFGGHNAVLVIRRWEE